MDVASPKSREDQSWLVRVWDKYTARATGCREASTLARHSRSVSAASTVVRERSLQIARNKSF